MTRRTRWLLWEITGGLAVVAVVTGFLVATSRETGEPNGPGAPPPTTQSTTTPEPQAALTGPALAVKIDNVPAARPQTGLGAADVVYVEQVEGGLTRLVAIYTRTPPKVIGPVRSARHTDLELLAQYGRPVLAYSGAAPELLPALHAADLVNASPAEAATAYYRNGDRPAPHNLYLRPERLPDDARGPAVAPLRFGPAPGAGTPIAIYRVGYPAANFAFTWSANHRQWLVSMNGTALTTTDADRVWAATVVRQQVQVTTSEPGEDTRTGSPISHTTGTGEAVFLRDGQQFTGTWSRPTPRSPTTFHTADGQELSLAAGPVWVLLTPA